MTRRSACIAALAVAACVLVSAVADAATLSGPVTLKKLLPQSGELPGFKPYGPVPFLTTITADVSVDPAPLKQADAANLRKDGFRAGLYQSQTGTGKSGGVAGVTELSSPAAAASYEKFTFAVVAKPGPVSGSSAVTRYLPFKVPGVPGAEGAAQISRKIKHSDANVEWVEGSCLVQVGDAVFSSTPATAPLVHAAQAIYKRTKGACASSGF